MSRTEIQAKPGKKDPAGIFHNEKQPLLCASQYVRKKRKADTERSPRNSKTEGIKVDFTLTFQ